MNPTAAWAILTARSPAYPRMPRGHGGLSRDDVSSMLTGLAPEAYLMGMAYECTDRRALHELELRLWQMIMKRAKEEEWHSPSQPFICRRLAGLALFEALDPLICLICNGKGTVTFNMEERPEYVLSPFFSPLDLHNGTIRCFTCMGSGKFKISARKRADLAGIHKFSWSSYWSIRYEPIYRLAKGWLADARAHLNHRLEANAEEV